MRIYTSSGMKFRRMVKLFLLLVPFQVITFILLFYVIENNIIDIELILNVPFSLMTACAIYLLAVFINYEVNSGTVVLDCGTHPQFIWHVLFFVPLGPVLTIMTLLIPDAPQLLGICGVVTTPPMTLFAFSRTQVREGGILFFGNLIKWSSIISYQWCQEGNEQKIATIRLIIKNRRIIRFPKRFNIEIPIPIVYKEKLEGLLAQYCPELTKDELNP